MLDYLKKQPLVGLALAIAGGIVLGFTALKGIHGAYDLYLGFGDDAQYMLIDIAIVVGLILLARYFIRKKGWQAFWNANVIFAGVLFACGLILAKSGIAPDNRLGFLGLMLGAAAVAGSGIRKWFRLAHPLTSSAAPRQPHPTD